MNEQSEVLASSIHNGEQPVERDCSRVCSFLEEKGVLPYWSNHTKNLQLYLTDCLDVMEILHTGFPEGLFDMIFADPPYFLSNGGFTCRGGRAVPVDKGKWDRSSGIEDVHAFNLKWLALCQKLLRPNGTIWVSGTDHVIHSIGFALQQLGMKLLNGITWEKLNPPPNLSCRYFTHATETILWAARDRHSKHCFNDLAMRKQNEGKQMRSVWRFAAAGRTEKVFGNHPTQKPISLLNRIVEASTCDGDWILDPFCGSGTTGLAAQSHNRVFLGCELAAEYTAIAKQRLEQKDKPLIDLS